MNTPLLSVIVPVYQAEKYLQDCLDSLLLPEKGQADYEIILIDDGSNDSSPQICDQCEANHTHVRVLHQPNQGVAITRNRGIKEAIGKYIAFVDADDTVDIAGLLSIASEIQEAAIDIACFGYNIYNNNCLIRQIGNVKATNSPITGFEFLQQQKDFKGFLWRYLFRSEYIRPYLFQKDLRWSEDIEWIQRVLIGAQKIQIFHPHLYNYYIRNNSLTHSYHMNVSGIIETKYRLIAYYKASMTSATRQWYNAAIGDVVESILTIVGKFHYPNRSEVLCRINDLCDSPYPTRYHSFIPALKLRIINLSPALYCWLRHII